MSGNDPAPASGGNDPAPASGTCIFLDASLTYSKQREVKEVAAQKATLHTQSDKLAPDQSSGKVLFHGNKEQNMLVDFSNDSTVNGEFLPSPWGKDGKLSEVYLQKGGDFEERDLKVSGDKTGIKTTKVMTDPSVLGTYFENLSETDQELKRLHASHIPADSKSTNIESILQKTGALGSDETLIAKVECKALINAPSTGYDIISDLVVAISRVKSDATPGGYYRRIHFIHAAEHERLSGSTHISELKTSSCCNIVNQSHDTNETSMSLGLQTSLYMDYLNVEEQIVQIFYQQVDGTTVDRHNQSSESQSCDICKCCKCCCCPCCCCPCACPDCFSCLFGANGREIKHDVKTRTAKALEKILVSESKLLTSEKRGDAYSAYSSSAATDVMLSNFNAIHFRWVDPLTHRLKESIALVSPTESALATCTLVSIATRGPNQLSSVAAAAAPPRLDFAPGKSAVDHLRKHAVIVPEVFSSSNSFAGSDFVLELGDTFSSVDFSSYRGAFWRWRRVWIALIVFVLFLLLVILPIKLGTAAVK